MKFTFLGTGTSGGVPSLGCSCAVCKSTDSHDKRLRSAALIETDTTRILIDSGPDIRQQLMPFPFKKIDGVLLTHIHYDHVAGIDDLRPFCVFGDINIYADENTVRALKQTMPYCFTEKLYPGVPLLRLHQIVPHLKRKIGDIEFTPIQIMHDRLPILGYRFGNFAYITDMKTIEATEYKYLRGVDTLVVNALKWEKPHHSHMLVGDTVEFAHKVGAQQTYFIHVNHQIGFHNETNRRLPEGFYLAYDGLQINV